MSGDNLTIVLFFIGTAITLAVAAVSQAGWKHPLLIWSLFGFAGIFAVAGFGWPELKTVSPPITAIVNQIATSPVAWFSVLMLGIAATFLLPKRNSKISDSLEQREPVIHTPSITTAPVVVPVAASPQKKVLVDVSPSYLRALYKDKTSVQGDASAAIFVGKWMTFTGKVADISLLSADLCLVQLLDEENKLISANFRGESKESVSHIAHNATITIRGEIAAVNALIVVLQKCELVETSPS